MSQRQPFDLPPRTETEHGDERRVGVEYEFTGLGIEKIAKIVKAAVGGSIEPESPYEYEIQDTPLGDFKIELDYAYLKKLGREPHEGHGGMVALEKLSEDVLAAVAKQVVPYEIVCPPVPVSRLHELEPITEGLREAGAQGTGESAIYAFGLHLNPELPGTDATTIRDYLRAYVVLYDWLLEVSEVDISRRVFPYIQHYGRDYLKQLTRADYGPDQAGLINDYLSHNASRNRAMDMLPLFAHLDRARVDEAIDDGLVNARPTLHYRLPNCEIERDDWSVRIPWTHWLAVERLASDPQRLAAATREYAEHLHSPVTGLIRGWTSRARAWAEGSA